MNNSLDNTPGKKAGIALVVFTLLLLFTMVLHPAGGSMEHLVNIAGVIIVTHSIAILSLPFGWIGFRGLTQKLGIDHFGALLALTMASLGMIAVMLAATANGLVLPIFLQHYKEATPETMPVFKLFMQYNSAVNHAFDYIYTGTFCLAILCWSITILLTRKLEAWLGWFGIALTIIIIAIFVFGAAVNSLQGLRLFVTGITAWILLSGIALYNQK